MFNNKLSKILLIVLVVALLLVLGFLEIKKEGYTSVKHFYYNKYIDSIIVVVIVIGGFIFYVSRKNI